jgi:pimeloyl-ACP methyl ester carboxylesterase
MASTAWLPVLEQLAAERRVIAFDLPGFGETAPLPSEVVRSPKAIAEELARVLQGMKIPLPVDIAGNSLGALIALECAKLGFARSVVGISPAGLWNEGVPQWVRMNLRLLRWVAKRIPRLAKQVVSTCADRAICLSIPVAAKGWKIPKDEAVHMLDTLAKATDFEAVAQAALEPFRDGKNISVPCTIAFGDRDWLLRKKDSQCRDQLPPDYRWSTLRGCGHVPMWDDRDEVVKLILGGTDSSRIDKLAVGGVTNNRRTIHVPAATEEAKLCAWKSPSGRMPRVISSPPITSSSVPARRAVRWRVI